ncbi:MAG: DUF2505 domain-containing protein [Bifidobacteriaceae bacterium]|jgi:hypothetical protein|nr:DUF2505 domain-containing protein [Bifidobacteriaceae bacterium]
MELRASERFAADAGDVAAILADPAFHRAAMARVGGGAVTGDVTVTGSTPGAFLVSIRWTMAADSLPEQVRAYVPGGLSVRHVNAWGTGAPDGTRHGTVTMDIVGAPIHLHGTVTLTPRGPGVCELVYVTSLRATIPFASGTIEQATAPAVRQALRAERDELVARLTPDSATSPAP